jgi:hypothetical protein
MSHCELKWEMSDEINLTKPSHHKGLGGQMAKLPIPGSAATSTMEDEYASLKAAASAVQRIRLSAQRELELAKKMRTEAQRYQKEIETQARSEAQQLILRTRLTTQREIEELIRKASGDIQKILADIRAIRITTQEELSAQRKFTNTAKLTSLSLPLKEGHDELE